MALPEMDRPSGRETRLVLLVVVVSLGVLMLLARFRFPAADLTPVTPAAGPLAGLAARATFDEMASAMASLSSRLEGSVLVIPIAAVPAPAGHAQASSRGTRANPPTPSPLAVSPPTGFVAAVRVRSDLAVAYMPPSMEPATRPGASGSPETIAPFPDRAIVLVRVENSPDSLVVLADSFAGFAYVGAVDVTASGPTVQPVFIGRADRLDSEGWIRPPRSLGRAGLTPGTFVFTLDGRLVGLVTRADDGVLVVPAVALAAVAADLPPKASGTQAP